MTAPIVIDELHRKNPRGLAAALSRAVSGRPSPLVFIDTAPPTPRAKPVVQDPRPWVLETGDDGWGCDVTPAGGGEPLATAYGISKEEARGRARRIADALHAKGEAK